ncbi:MAG: MBL fold metallo-hydrolase, partial [Brooklawnia sp.]|uniref:MBL fold metallo-hydrolase n=1 Tax=Brooklawnia sp. TaxID=2699740 RepID=UPI003C782076
MTGLRRISPHCWVSTSSFCSTNSVVVVGATQAVVIDPGVTGAELARLAAGLAELGVGCAFGISTHPDWDHLLWHPGLGDAPRYASARAV